MDEFTRLMRLPRFCRACGKQCGGLRCRQCWTLEGRITRILKDVAPQGMEEEKIAQILTIENELLKGERAGTFHETPKGWGLGLHPEQTQLMQAWIARRAHELELNPRRL